MKNQLRGSLTLLLATVIWGSAFIAQSVGMDHIGPFTFQAVRCGLAVAFLVPAVCLFDRAKGSRAHSRDLWKEPRLWKAGAVCGAALFVASGLQQVGLQYTTAGKAGFITALYIVLVPVLGLFLGKKPPLAVWFSVAIATAGMYLLSCVGVTEINFGDILLILCALAFSVQITLIDRLSPGLDSLRLNCVQALVCALLSAAVMFLTESPRLSNILACWLPLCYAGILSMGVAYTMQIIGQKALEPAPASLIMSLESVFALLCGWLILKEQLTKWELLGCCLVFAAVILSQLPGKKTR